MVTMSSSTISHEMKAYSIKSFNNTNYLTWSIIVEAFLRKNDLFSIVDKSNFNLETQIL
jgi:hypothetical protein